MVVEWESVWSKVNFLWAEALATLFVSVEGTVESVVCVELSVDKVEEWSEGRSFCRKFGVIVSCRVPLIMAGKGGRYGAVCDSEGVVVFAVGADFC